MAVEVQRRAIQQYIDSSCDRIPPQEVTYETAETDEAEGARVDIDTPY